MFDPEKAIKKMLGPGINVPKFGKSSSNDLDGDGINNIMDCQPKNMFRQDGNNEWVNPRSYNEVSGDYHDCFPIGELYATWCKKNSWLAYKEKLKKEHTGEMKGSFILFWKANKGDYNDGGKHYNVGWYKADPVYKFSEYIKKESKSFLTKGEAAEYVNFLKNKYRNTF